MLTSTFRSFFRISTLTGFMLYIGLGCLTHGQSPTGPSNHGSLAFSVYPVGYANWRDIYYQAKPGVYTPLTFWSYERSPKHAFNGLSPITFYRKETTPHPDGSPRYTGIASASFEAISDAYLFFFIPLPASSEKNSQAFQIIPFNEAIHRFPLDTVTFVNATGVNLEGVFGNKPILLKQGISTPYDLKPFYHSETLIGFAISYEGRLQKVLQSRWSFYPNYREIILLLPPKEAGSLRIQAFRITQHKEEIHPVSASPETED